MEEVVTFIILLFHHYYYSISSGSKKSSTHIHRPECVFWFQILTSLMRKPAITRCSSIYCMSSCLTHSPSLPPLIGSLVEKTEPAEPWQDFRWTPVHVFPWKKDSCHCARAQTFLWVQAYCQCFQQEGQWAQQWPGHLQHSRGRWGDTHIQHIWLLKQPNVLHKNTNIALKSFKVSQSIRRRVWWQRDIWPVFKFKWRKPTQAWFVTSHLVWTSVMGKCNEDA